MEGITSISLSSSGGRAMRGGPLAASAWIISVSATTFRIGGAYMDNDAAKARQLAEALSALGHPERLQAYRLVFEAGASGMTPGTMVSITGARQNTVSGWLRILQTSGLILRRREGRTLRYFASADRLEEVRSAFRYPS